MPVTKIAPRIGMEPNSLSRTLNSLEDKGAIVRKQDENDQRKVLVFMTAEGKKLRKIALKTVFELEKRISENITPKQMQIFNEVINQVYTSLDSFKNEMAEK